MVHYSIVGIVDANISMLASMYPPRRTGKRRHKGDIVRGVVITVRVIFSNLVNDILIK
jgi:hypothetical protein